MAYTHRKKNPSSDSIMKVTNFQDDSQLSYENYQVTDIDRPLTSWEKGELREFIIDQGLTVLLRDTPTFSDFFRIVGRGPEYFSDKKKGWVIPEIGKII